MTATVVRRGPLPRLVRRHTWDGELAQYLDAWRGRPFVWGESDCGQLVAGALAVMTGVALERILVGVPRYATPRTATRAAVRAGGTLRMEGRLRDLGLIDVDGGLAFAQRGDVVVADRGSALDALGLVWSGAVWTTHPGAICAPYPIADTLHDAIVLRVP